jgi:hypothetical protein
VRKGKAMKKALLVVVLGGAIAIGAAAAGQKANGQKPSGKVTCTLTNTTSDKCCCVEKDGKLYCPLAKKTVDPCCCKPAEK